MKSKVTGFPNGDVRIPYKILVEIETHFQNEHEISEKCGALRKLKELHMVGVDAACAD